MIMQVAPTPNTGKAVRRILAGLVKANVAVQRYCVRVVVKGTRSDAELAASQLREFGFRGVCNSELYIISHGERHTINAYSIKNV